MGEWTGGHRSECNAIRELKAALLAAVPLLSAANKLGTTRLDGSRHDAGLAMDIMLDSRNIDEKPQADKIIDAVVTLHPKMKWSDILYTDWNGSKPVFFHIPGASPFGGIKGMLKKNPSNPKLGLDHINHIHIDWWTGNATTLPVSSMTTGFKDDLIKELQKPTGRWEVHVGDWTWIYIFDHTGAVEWQKFVVTNPVTDKGTGTWVLSGKLRITWNNGSLEDWDTPLSSSAQSGRLTKQGNDDVPLTERERRITARRLD